MKEKEKKSGMRKVIKKFLELRKDRADFREIKKRIKANNLLKDLPADELENWKIRTNDVLSSPDNHKIICADNAGTLSSDGLLVMHNGLKIKPLSYYGYPVLKMLLENKGIHEPQEEYAFQEVLKSMPDKAVMIELGAYWSFYSMWFNKQVKNPSNFMIEPWEIQHGIRNFKLNNLAGNFFQHYIADKPGVHTDGSKIISVDSFVKDQKIQFVDILHSDIQGNELLMLNGAKEILSAHKVGYIFISTHSDSLHSDCKKFLLDLNYLEVCSADMKETCSYDGLLVFKNPNYQGVEKIQISLKES